MNNQVPPSLRAWFLVHFIVDMVFALPLLLAPSVILPLFGLPVTNLLLARLVGAALLGIGGASFVMRDAGSEVYRAMLDLKILWSLAALLGIGISLFEGAPQAVWGLFLTFGVFFGTWVYYRL